ncbi:hypothetical protein [Alteromonas confluentis]|mgnify:CR=1|uniref:DUF2946 domain-containing protein n=1 Tax=Alteromonas confluentis TaxID=1656094 RepID=A0A1E7Z6M3_9ALTE|nr:hypothetical protein [Alteromonas confluentis]OFC69193.1 hypothetical protein BFC18_20985 [Alteromonas confluentis]
MRSRSFKTLILLLLLSVSSQAMSVVFDSHAAHQDTDFHVKSDAVDISGTQFQEDPKTTDKYGLDCQHCCHCHGAQHIYLPVAVKALNTDNQFYTRHSLIQPLTEGHWSNLLRPPIA